MVLGPARYGAAEVEAVRHVAFLADNQALLTAWNLVIYVAFGVFLVVLSLALQARLRGGAPDLANVAAAFGLIWAGLVIASGMVANVGMGVIVDLHARDPAQAGVVWQAYKFVVAGLGGGNEIVGGLWVLLTSLAALRSGGLPRPLNLLGLVVGGAGLLTTIPPLAVLGEIFGLGLIVWFAWLAVVMLRGRASAAASPVPLAPSVA
jgi:hypothetical protein